jgi:hypothetical protein
LQAIPMRHTAVVRLLLEAGADVHILDHVGRPVLQVCTVYGAPPDMIDVLREYGASS